MRCNNCGWDNAPGSSTCVKCGHPLQMDSAGYGNNNPYQGVNVPNYNQGAEQQPKATVINAQAAVESAPRPTRMVNAPGSPQPQGAPVAQGPTACPHCGYPVIGDFTSCPNCGASVTPAPAPVAAPATPAAPRPTVIQRPGQGPAAAPVPRPTVIQRPGQESAAPQPAAPQAVAPQPAAQKVKSELADLGIDETVKCDKCGAEVSIDFSFCPKCGERIHLPTVRAIRHKPTPAPEPPKPHCHLTLIPEEDEQTEATRNDYEGPSVILTRENTEANNRTITSKEQAELICEDGKWFVLNKSELGSTYLEASRKLELQQGDIIVLGDRRFKFEAE